MMSGIFGGTSSTNTNQQIDLKDLPETYKQKELRIAHLPYFLDQEQTARYLPPGTIRQLQGDVSAVVSSLHAPGTKVVDAFNQGLRHLLPYKTLSPANAALVNHAFGNVLERSGATPEQEAALQADMNQLAFVDSKSIQPTLLARQDYGLVMQTTLAVGRPIQTPAAAPIAQHDGLKVANGLAAFTRSHNPIFNGTYQAGATRIGYLRIQLLDQFNQTIGVGVVDPSGSYSVYVTTPLPFGTYKVRTQAVDEVGHTSAPSPHAFTLKVVSKIPRT